MMRQLLRTLLPVCLILAVGSEVQAGGLRKLFRGRRRACGRSAKATSATTRIRSSKPQWQALFDGKSLGKWKVTNFGGEGEVTIKDQAIRMGFGNPISGVTYNGKLPETNYEIRLEAMKVDGIDFFCGLTFPVAKSHCSFIVGGWAGGVVGLSNIDDLDASENDTTTYMTFKKAQWYKIRVRVQPHQIRAWIDDKLIVDQDIKDKKIDTRPEVDLSKPLGISAFETKAALRNIQVRTLSDAEKK